MVFRETTYSVLIVSAAEKFIAALRALLPVTDYWPVEVAHSVGEARRMLPEREFDIVIINSPLPDEFGSRLAADICSSSSAGVLLFVKSDIYENVTAKVTEQGVLTLPRPTSNQMVAQSLRTLCSMRERMRRFEEKQLSIEEKIEEIRLVNHAKWLLIERLSMSEAGAQRYIEKQAMDMRITKREAAEAIIKTYE